MKLPNTQPLVSIVTPSFNQGAFIADAITFAQVAALGPPGLSAYLRGRHGVRSALRSLAPRGRHG